MEIRCSSIISTLLKTNHPIPISFFADEYQITERSIRSDLNNIDDFLLRNGYPCVSRSRHGLFLELTDDRKKSLCQLISEGDLGNYSLQQDRLKGIQLQLLFVDAPITIADISETFQVSRSTIVNDISRLRGKYPDLGIIASNRGFYIELDEWERRIHMAQLFSTIFPAGALLENLMWGAKDSDPLMGLTQQSYFSAEQLQDAYRIAVTIESGTGAVWSDQWMVMVLFAVLVCKLRQDHPIRPKEEVRKTWDYAAILRVLPNISVKPFGKADRDFVTLIVLCAQTHNISYFKKENQARIQVVANRVIRYMESAMDCCFLSANELHEKLNEYLSHAYYRIRYGVSPGGRWIQGADVLLEKFVRILEPGLKAFRDFVGKEIPVCEQQRIAALFYEAYILEQVPMFSRYRAVLVIDEEQCCAGLLMAWLIEMFPQVDILSILPCHQLNIQTLRENVDFVITTLPLLNKNIPEFIIKSVENDTQLDSLREYMARNPPRQTNTWISSRHLMQKVLRIAGSVCDRRSYNRFVEQLTAQIGPLDIICYGGEMQMLRDLMTIRTIRLAVSAKDWEEAVRIGGNLMVEAGCVQPQFVDMMINFVVENGPYVVIAPGIALPHAKPENGVERPCISLVTLEHPVEFGNEDNDPVDLIISLASTDNSSHLDALAELFDLLEDKDKLAQIRAAKIPEEIISLLK